MNQNQPNIKKDGHTGRKLLYGSTKRKQLLLTGLAFVFGVAIGMLLFSLLRPSMEPGWPDTNLLGGTMMTDKTTGDWTTNSTLQLQGTQFRGTCQSRYNESLVEVYLTITSGEPVQTILEFDPQDFSLEMVVNLETDASTRVNSTDGKIEITSTASNRLAIRLSNKNSNPHNLLLQVVENSMQAAQNTIPVNQNR